MAHAHRSRLLGTLVGNKLNSLHSFGSSATCLFQLLSVSCFATTCSKPYSTVHGARLLQMAAEKLLHGHRHRNENKSKSTLSFADVLSSSGCSVLFCSGVLFHAIISPPPMWLDLHMPEIHPCMTSDMESSRLQIFNHHPCLMTRGLHLSPWTNHCNTVADDVLSLLQSATYHSHALFASAVLMPFQRPFSLFNHPPLARG